MNKRILIAYFSWSGNTETIARKIQETTGGAIFRIETKHPYPGNYHETAYGIAKEQHDKNILPELKDNGDISDYDIIFVGTPAWWYTMAPAVKTFLTNHNFAGKTIIPFVTHGGGGGYTIAEDMQEITKTKVLKPLVIHGSGSGSIQKEINEWLIKCERAE